MAILLESMKIAQQLFLLNQAGKSYFEKNNNNKPMDFLEVTTCSTTL